MKNIFKKIFFSVLVTCLFISCSDFSNSDSSFVTNEKGRIIISTNLDSQSRSVLPTGITEQTQGLTWELVGTCEEKTYSKEWDDTISEDGSVTSSAYNNMISDNGLLLDVGTWSFSLKVKNNNGYVLVGKQEATITSGGNILSFVMNEATSDDLSDRETVASGSIEFTLKFPKDVIDNVVVSLSKINTSSSVVEQNLIPSAIADSDYESLTFYAGSDTNTSLKAGSYILKMELQQQTGYTDSGDGNHTPLYATINTYTCLVRVAPGLCSKGEYTLETLAKLYTIKYECGKGTFDDTVTITTSYNAYTTFILPTPTLNGHTFEGWYTDENYTIPINNDGTFKLTSDTTVYAKWIKNVEGITHANNTLYISSYEGLKVFRNIVNGSLESNITIPANAANSGASVNCNAGTPVTTYNAELQSNITITEDWTPIGVYTNASSQVPYVGQFKGNNNTITFDENVSINSQAAGLFGAISNGCKISNLIIEGNIVSTSTSYVGGIVGYATGGSVLNCVNRAKIQGTWAGGIAGKTQSTSFNGCVNFGEINGTNYSAGIVGSAASDTSINLCVNIGNLTSSATACGISGDVPTEITVQNCINLGTLSATNYIYGISSGSGTISSNISAGKFEGEIKYSCYAVSSSASNKNYYDNSICADNNFYTASAVGMATSDFSSWSPDDWSAEEGRYPLPTIVATDNLEGISELVWNEICELAKVDTSSSGGSGTATGITFAGYDSSYTTGSPKFYITTAEGLATFRNMVNGTVEGSITILKDGSSTSTSDYIVTSETVPSPIYGELKSDIELSSDENWIPIGSSENPFLGYFSGNNHTVSNLNINATTDNQGLFGVVEGTANNVWCTITNLVVEGNITSSECNVAGIAGKATLTKFENCVNKATVESISTASNVAVAGIAGYVTNVDMKYCYNAGSITASSGVAGIAGYETESDNFYEYAYCINSGIITGGTNYSSIIGIANSSLYVYACANYGEIISTTDNETGCIIGTCMTTGSAKTYVYDILSVGTIKTQGTYHVITKTADIETSFYDSKVLSSEEVDGLSGFETSNFIDDDPQMDFYEDWYYTPGVYPIPNIEEYVSEEIWEEIVAAATPQNSGSSGIVINANVSTFSDLKTKIESVIDTYTLDNPYVIAISDSFGTDLDTASPITVSSHVKLVAATTDGCSISKTDAYASVNIFTVAAGASLTLGDSNADGELIIDGNETLTTTTKSLINVSGTLVLNEKSTLQNNKCKEVYATNGAAVYSDGGTVKILGGTVKNNSNSYKNNTGGAIYIKNGTFEMTAGIVSNNSSYSSGGAIYVDNSTVTISGGTFENNKASIASGNSVYGGALYLSSCTVNITGGIFTNNSTIPEGSNTNTQFYGGAIYIIGSGTDTNFAIISGCDFAGNSAYQNGGAIYTGGNSYININNSSFENNTVLNDTAQGSAVYINNTGGNINVNNCTFNNNTTSDTIFTVYNGSTGGTHQVNGSELSQNSGYNPN